VYYELTTIKNLVGIDTTTFYGAYSVGIYALLAVFYLVGGGGGEVPHQTP
jgi:hypothetical protein